MHPGRASRLGDMILFSLIAGLWKGFCFTLVVLWRLYNRLLGALAGRPVDHCRSLFLFPAQFVGCLGCLLLFTGATGLFVLRAAEGILMAVLMLALGAGAMFVTRILIRRGCL